MANEPECGRCGAEGRIEDHPCPYQTEINGDFGFQCNCCDECRTDCIMEI